ncbi:MAG: DHHA1 domain-containing protein [Planctomycetia bacterium]|nr:DHHA1 domain-containing protein [Planctomycetia bacterium]
MSKHRPKHWKFRPGERDISAIAEVAKFANLPMILAKLLVARGGCSPNQAAMYLDPKLGHLCEPNLLPGCARAAEIIRRTLVERKKIAVYGDYDVDGMTATAILMRCLRQEALSCDAPKPIFFIPNRMTEGYGLNLDAIRDLKERGVQLIVTVDCGITAVDETKLAHELGIEIIVTDHHQPGRLLPEAEAIVHADICSHPQFLGNERFLPLPDDEFLALCAKDPESNVRPFATGDCYPFAHLSGAGVAFKLAWAICQRCARSTKVGARRQALILETIVLAAIGTIADVVSLTGENRAIVVQGLSRLRTSTPLGLEALLKVSNLFDKAFFEAEDVGFSLAPRLNAAGRLEQAWLGVDLLTTEDAETARETALYLDELNAKRREMENKMLREAVAQLKMLYPDPDTPPPAIVLASPNWHPGIIGIVAGKLTERFNAPTVLISLSKTNSSGSGSARSISSVPDFNLYDALSRCAEHIGRFGGHAGAAGLRIEADKVEAFREAFCAVVEEMLPPGARTPELWIDSEEMLEVFTLANVQALNRLAPFGTDNPAPIFATSHVYLAQPPAPLGKQRYDNDESRPIHLALNVEQRGRSFRLVAFNQGEFFSEFDALYKAHKPFDVAFRPVLNAFNGSLRVDFHLTDWREERC